jgi:hypothetical protein
VVLSSSNPSHSVTFPGRDPYTRDLFLESGECATNQLSLAASSDCRRRKKKRKSSSPRALQKAGALAFPRPEPEQPANATANSPAPRFPTQRTYIPVRFCGESSLSVSPHSRCYVAQLLRLCSAFNGLGQLCLLHFILYSPRVVSYRQHCYPP